MKLSHKQNFITKSSKVHNNKYDYSLVNYVNSKTKVIIICPTHGEFEQQPNNHSSGRGCSKCAIAVFDTPSFIFQANLVHKNLYDYTKTVYTNTKTKVTIECKTHGEFSQVPNAHLSGQGCPECGKTKAGLGRKLTKKQFITKANKLHNSKYSYAKLIYTSIYEKVLITCPYHGDFKQTAHNHLVGHGCMACARESSGWTKSRYENQPAYFYILQLEDNLFKVGLTKEKTIDVRYKKECLPSTSKFIFIHHFCNGALAWDLEKYILRHLKDYKYTGPQIFKRTGISEMLTINPTLHVDTYLREHNLL